MVIVHKNWSNKCYDFCNKKQWPLYNDVILGEFDNAWYDWQVLNSIDLFFWFLDSKTLRSLINAFFWWFNYHLFGLLNVTDKFLEDRSEAPTLIGLRAINLLDKVNKPSSWLKVVTEHHNECDWCLDSTDSFHHWSLPALVEHDLLYFIVL